MKSICIAILNYNGVHYLQDLLPSIEYASRRYKGLCKILVLDNSPSDEDRFWLQENYPDIEVISAPCNDYLFSYNWLLPQLSEDIAILLNNDIKVDQDFIEPLIEHFKADDVFAVSATSLDWEGNKYTCGPAFLSQEYTLYRWGYNCSYQQVSHTLYASGGFSAFDRQKFIELGGFNQLFYPAYCEDLDLGFRAWRKGWRCIFEPRSKVYHYNQGSWSKEKSEKVEKIRIRAELLFVWSSLPPIGSFLQRFVMTGWIFYLNLRNRKWWAIGVWFKTWLEWQRISLQDNYKLIKATSAEIESLEQRLMTPVPKT
jgi:GT2 family glycosyltransferase